MLSMTEEEVRAIMKTHGWNYKERSPKRHAKYIYARRREGAKMAERYICPLSDIGDLTESELIAKLTAPPADTS